MKKLYACWFTRAHEHRTKNDRDECDNKYFWALKDLNDKAHEIAVTKGKSDEWREAALVEANEAFCKVMPAPSPDEVKQLGEDLDSAVMKQVNKTLKWAGTKCDPPSQQKVKE